MKTFLIIIAAITISGCGKIAKNYIPGDILQHNIDPSVPYITKEGLIDVSKIKISNFEGSGKRTARNEIIARAISLSDQKCTMHKALILSNANAWNVGTGSTAILLAGTSSVLTHAKTASDLAAAAAATSGIQSLVNKEVYADALGTTILRSIDIARTKAKAPLEKGMLDDNYSLSTAFMDIQNYHNTCSLMAGLVEVTKAFDNRKLSKEELERDKKALETELENISNNPNFVNASSTKAKISQKIEDKILQLSDSEE